MGGKGKGSWDTLPCAPPHSPGASSTSENTDACKHMNLPEAPVAPHCSRIATLTLNYTRSAGQFTVVASLLARLVKMGNYHFKLCKP